MEGVSSKRREPCGKVCFRRLVSRCPPFPPTRTQSWTVSVHNSKRRTGTPDALELDGSLPSDIRVRSSKIFWSLASFGNVSHVLKENARTTGLHLWVHHQSSSRRRSFTLQKSSNQLSIFCFSIREFLRISCRPSLTCGVFCYVS